MRLRVLACPGRSGGWSGRQGAFPTPAASCRTPSTDAPSIAAELPARPGAASTRPAEADPADYPFFRSDPRGEEVEQPRVDPRPGRLDLTEHRIDIDPPVRWPVPVESDHGLLELSTRARRVPFRRVVPRHRDMDEPLKEVPLLLGRLAPLLLERLVCIEPTARAHPFEAVGERHLTSIPSPSAVVYVRPMATILLVGVDLFFRSKLEGLLPGHRLVTHDAADPPDIVICDIARVDANDVADTWPETPILGFANHTDTQGLQRAHAAGFDRVIVKSALVERASDVVAELVGTAPDG